MSLQPVDKERQREDGIPQEILWARPGSGVHYFCPHYIGQIAVTMLHLTARESGKCGLAVGPGGKRNRIGKQPASLCYNYLYVYCYIKYKIC